ncbi:hypothetical protein CBD41_08865 [bacterium TMED181]|nr:MAG: hypothetical protein CBD41_08865 [bacterium TMED181]
MKKSEIVKLATLIANIDDRETMNNVISLIKDQQKIVRAKATIVAKATLVKGALVKVVGGKKIKRQEGTDVGTLLKVNRTRADVQINGSTWTVPMTMLEVL